MYVELPLLTLHKCFVAHVHIPRETCFQLFFHCRALGNPIAGIEFRSGLYVVYGTGDRFTSSQDHWPRKQKD